MKIMTDRNPADEVAGGICRDFLRNVCRRGERCKYKHPVEMEKKEKEGLQDKMMFCHDFQNNRLGCSRNNCKFIHCDRETEDEYKRSGYLPPAIRDQVIRKGVAVDFPAVSGGVPVCKDYLKGNCSRDNCKFRHMSPMEYDMEMNQYQGGGGQANSGGYMEGPARYNQHPETSMGPPPQGGGRASSGGFGFFEEEEMMYERRKRRYMEGPARYEQQQESSMGPPPQAFQMLQEENGQLRLRCDELEKRVSDLTATNEFLLDQNAQIRMEKMGGKNPGVSGAPMSRAHPGQPGVSGQPHMVGYTMHL